MPKETFFNLPEDKRNTILSCAIDEFAENDFESASISRLVAEAGIAKGSFYQYFEDKHDLYLHLLDEGARQKAAFLQNHPPPDETMGVFAYMRWLLMVGASFEYVNPKITKVAQRAFYGGGPITEEIRKTAREAGEAFFGQIVERGIAQGEIDPDIDRDAAVFIFWVTGQELGNYLLRRFGNQPEETDLLGVIEQHKEEAEAIYDGLLKIIEFGMRPKSSSQDTS